MAENIVKNAIFRGTTIEDVFDDIKGHLYICRFRFYHDLAEAVEKSFDFARKRGKDSRVTCCREKYYGNIRF